MTEMQRTLLVMALAVIGFGFSAALWVGAISNVFYACLVVLFNVIVIVLAWRGLKRTQKKLEQERRDMDQQRQFYFEVVNDWFNVSTTTEKLMHSYAKKIGENSHHLKILKN